MRVPSRSTSPTRKRRYRMRVRASATEATGQRILDAATELFLASSYDEVTLGHVAARAGVALKTVLRRFGSKDELLLTCGRRYDRAETQLRVVEVGDIAQVARVLATRYERQMDMMSRYLAVEQRVAPVAELLAMVRKGHRRWLGEVFAPYLPERPGPRRRRRVAELFAATEIYVWHSWRRRLGLGRESAEHALREMLEALVTGWTVNDQKNQGGTHLA